MAKHPADCKKANLMPNFETLTISRDVQQLVAATKRRYKRKTGTIIKSISKKRVHYHGNLTPETDSNDTDTTKRFSLEDLQRDLLERNANGQN